MSDEEENPDGITAKLCKAYRQTLTNQINDLKDDLKRMENRQWGALAGIGLTILLTILSLVMRAG